MRTPTTLLLTRLRKLMSAEVPALSAYIVPSCDAHNSEYLAPCDERRAFITGFTGSAGTAIITPKHALLWTDARYFQQAEAQMDENWTLMKEGRPGTPSRGLWLANNLESGKAAVGYDPMLCTMSQWTDLKRNLDAANIKLVSVDKNLIDAVWGSSRPERPNQPIFPLPMKYAGMTWEAKVEEVRVIMKEKQRDVLVLTALDDIAWLLNLRGSDITFNPVFFSYLVLTLDRIHLFVTKEQVTEDVVRHLKPQDDVKNIVEIMPYESIRSFVSGLREKSVWFSGNAPEGLVSLCKKDKTLLECSPVTILKSVKNDIELSGFEKCHIRDAAALCEYFAWLEKEVPKGAVTEISGATKLRELRAQMEDFVGLSFETISSVGPNASVIHYKPTEETNRVITTEEIYLVDSGGQYKDGTTDVTRTLHFGTPSAFEKECFTRVLKGQTRLSMAVFPRQSKGHRLDSLARTSLWEIGLDYGHGTGHGVGSYLNVHEGPMGISWRPHPDDCGLMEGQVLSNEPGYYEDGKFGIRIENLVKVVSANTKHDFNKTGFLTFEQLTVVPIQVKMIEPSLLTREEIVFLNNYHQKCLDDVGPLLREMGFKDGLKWLINETKPVG